MILVFLILFISHGILLAYWFPWSWLILIPDRGCSFVCVGFFKLERSILILVKLHFGTEPYVIFNYIVVLFIKKRNNVKYILVPLVDYNYILPPLFFYVPKCICSLSLSLALSLYIYLFQKCLTSHTFLKYR